MSAHGMSSATSLTVKSNSLRATKSTAVPAIRLFSGSTATFAPMKPILMFGLMALIISAVFTSDLNDGVEVCITTRSRFFNSGMMSANFRSCGGASINLLPSTSAAGWASQVGYQNERTSRFIW